MTSIKSISSDSVITLDYDDFNNSVEIHIGNNTGFRFVNIDRYQCQELIDALDELKNEII